MHDLIMMFFGTQLVQLIVLVLVIVIEGSERFEGTITSTASLSTSTRAPFEGAS